MIREVDLKAKKAFLLIFMVLAVFVVYVGRMFYLSVILYNPITEKNRNELLYENLKERADIVDRNGKILATDVKTKDLYIIKELLEDENFAVKELSKLLGVSEKHLLEKITRSKGKNILIKRYIMPPLEKQLRQLPIAAISFTDNLLRYYLHDNLFANVIGYTDVERNGIIGMENFYDNYLKNSSEPLKLTLDLNVQNTLYNELKTAQKQYQTNFIVGIISEIKTGNILAAISLPDYNLNKNDDKIKSFNKITQGLYEAGSILKIFTISNALENKVVTRDTVIDVSQPIEYLNFVIKDGRQVKKKKLTVTEIFLLSSNIGVVKLAEKLGKTKQVDFFEKVGLLERIVTDFNQTSLPLQPRIWKDINLMTISYGYGIAISPLHIIQATNAILNDGNFISPRFSYNFDNQVKRRVLSKETSDTIKNFFSLTTKQGTAAGSGIDGLNFGGKTGTAEKISAGSYKKGEHLASFVGAFPMQDPQYSVFILMDRPKDTGGEAGGMAASRVAKDVVLGVIKFLDIKPIY
ncbi:MAG: penicillin-binding protein 2 [Rickettsiales bacterium]|jgi:cell division protein FtsI (penicillin-binding protein 3)|nr:penicillin-binding protein 2 [Rickettsiales bacterium]